MNNTPVPMKKDELLYLLDTIRAAIERGDSWEGHLEYGFPWDENDPEPDDPEQVDFRVRAGYRVGNLDGQGGFVMVGTLAEES